MNNLKYKFLLIFLFFAVSGFSQTLDSLAIAKLDFRFQNLIKRESNKKQFKINEPDSLIPCLIRILEDTSHDLPILTNSAIPNFVTAHITLSEMIELIKLENVLKISPGAINYSKNDLARGLTGVDLIQNGFINTTSYDGTGVITLIIDSGIDWSHPDFRNITDQTKSRILYLWDQTLTKQGAEKTPADRDPTHFGTLTYGVEYSQSDINNEIDGSSAGFVRETDYDGHGTHVAGTVSGNGYASTSKFKGMAPKSTIVVVKAGNGSFSEINIINALTYARKISETENKPIVVNMSLGGHYGSHDGTGPQETAVNSFCTSGNGRIVVIAGGNDGNNAIHISGTVSPNSSINVTLNVPSYTANAGSSNDFFVWDGWWNTGSSINISLTSPNGFVHSQAGYTQGSNQSSDGSSYIYNFQDSNYPNGQLRNYIEVYDGNSSYPPASGNWTLTFTNPSATNSFILNGWLVNKSMPVTLNSANSISTIGIPGTAANAITVGSFVSRWDWMSQSSGSIWYGSPVRADNISDFSSMGPTRDGRMKPELTAPGQAIVSARSVSATYAGYSVIDNNYVTNQGTSMATPVVSGAIALMLQANPNLSASQIKDLLTENTISDEYTGVLPNYTFGFGKLNLLSSFAKMVNPAFVPAFQVSQQDKWNYAAFRFNNTVQNSKLAVRFTPVFDGFTLGVFFHPGAFSGFASPLSFEVWTDISGKPGSQIGLFSSSYPLSSMMQYSWNFLSFGTSGVQVNAGTPYHLVMNIPTFSTFTYAMDDNISVANSSQFQSGIWSSLAGFNWRIRPYLAKNAIPDNTLPVEITDFNGHWTDNDLVLEWVVESELNNIGFSIEWRSISEEKWIEAASFQTSGELKGQGTSSVNKKYKYYFKNPNFTDHIDVRLKDWDFEGNDRVLRSIKIVKPARFYISDGYPNPFNPTTSFQIELPVKGKVDVEVYNSLGQRIVKNSFQGSQGMQTIPISLSNQVSGTYFVCFRSGSQKEIRKVIYLK
ncbi:MAG: S8 family peptidase [Bacteroidetes bacterium]|nr:S8 family peptidase [Bacteroidota bacterium]